MSPLYFLLLPVWVFLCAYAGSEILTWTINNNQYWWAFPTYFTTFFLGFFVFIIGIGYIIGLGIGL